eukprot:CAMPEP_0117518082 /NCGR_PEP_ID=MMETSP0784-20121206/31947_1 /TAXON_ID=39447 /ORGANISM="" /LENGTH=192 /DNA_ID=CAMNT_0005313989 /DNA_START=150 /DNA_END=726 /DNA_ORIENTATION=+
MADWAIPSLRPDTRNKKMRARELAFVNSAKVAALPEYKPLFDENLKHMWVNPRTRATLQAAGFVDERGNVIDVDAHRRKWYVIEHELAQAACVERERAYERDRRIRERQIAVQRQDIHENQQRSIAQTVELRRQRREQLKAEMAAKMAMVSPSPSSGSRLKHSASLPAMGGRGQPPLASKTWSTSALAVKWP